MQKKLEGVTDKILTTLVLIQDLSDITNDLIRTNDCDFNRHNAVLTSRYYSIKKGDRLDFARHPLAATIRFYLEPGFPLMMLRYNLAQIDS